MEPLFNADYTAVYCPICRQYFPISRHLKMNFFPKYPNTCWIANNVTHYRHAHTKWDEFWSFRGRKKWTGNYDREKNVVNEFGKRHILRNHADYLNAHGILPEDYMRLHGNDKETLQLISELLK